MASDFVERMNAPVPPLYPNRCSVGRVLRALPPKDAQAFADALTKVKDNLEGRSATGHSAKWLSQALAEFGHQASQRMIRRHCHGECSCGS